MATINANLSVSSNISDYGLSISKSMTMKKAGTTDGLEKTTGLHRRSFLSTNQVDLLTAGSGRSSDVTASKAAKLYIKNIGTSATEYFTVGFGKANTGATKEDFSVAASAERSVELGRLYSGDFMIIPWDAASDENDIFVKPSVATNMVIEYMVFYE